MTRVTLLSVSLMVICLAFGCQTVNRSHVPLCDAGHCGLTQFKLLNAGEKAKLHSTSFQTKSTERGEIHSNRSQVALASYAKQEDGGLLTSRTSSSFDSEIEPAAHSSNNESVNSFTLEAAEQYAVSNNPDLVKAQAEIESLQGKHLQVGLKPNPQVGYISADVGEEGTAGQQGGFFSQEFIRGNKLKLNRSIVCQEIEVAKQQLEINRQKLLTEVRQRFYDLLVAQERLAIVNKFERLTQRAVSTSNKLFEAEEISRIANLRAKLQAKNTAIVVEQANNELAGATRRFAAVTGVTLPDTVAANSITAVGDVYPQTSQIDPQESLATILSGSPELAQSLFELERAKWNLNRQVAEPTRNVQVQTSVTHGNATSDDLFAIQVGVPLRINDRNQGNISSARADIVAKNKNIESIQRDLSKRFSVTWRDYENARIQFEKYQNEIIPETSEVYKLVASAFKEGEIGYLDLVTAQQTYLDASLQNLTALREFWRSAALIDGYLLSE